MVGGPTSGEQENLLLPGDASNVLPKSVGIGNAGSSILGAEDTMHQITSMRVGHIATLPRLHLSGCDGRHVPTCSTVPIGLLFFLCPVPSAEALG